MTHKIYLNSNEYFSTTDVTTSANRTFAIDWSFLEDDTSPSGNKSYSMTYNFLSKYIGLEYPPVGMTEQNTTIAGQAYGNGTYTANASSNGFIVGGTSAAWHAFDKTLLHWRSNGVYPNPTGRTTLTGGTIIDGEWVEIILPSAIILDKFNIQPRGASSPQPRMIKLVGRNNNADDWDVIYEVDSVSFNMINVNPNKSFRQYRLVILTNGGAVYTEFQELYLYGYVNPLEPRILRIDTGSFPEYVMGSNLNNKIYTNSLGVLLLKNNHLYAKPSHHQPIIFNRSPNNNFLTIDIFRFGGKNRVADNNPYQMELTFEEIDEE
jgi:hypothetical protein